MDDEGIDDICIENSHENGKGNLRNSSSSDTEGEDLISEVLEISNKSESAKLLAAATACQNNEDESDTKHICYK